MSIQIYSSDNMSIYASSGNIICSDEKSIPTIRINIAILVNGKLKDIFQEYKLCEIKSLDGKDSWYELGNYEAMYILDGILSDLGYKVENIKGIIQQGIDNL